MDMQTASTLFTQRWIETWKANINSSKEYREHGRNWQQPVLLQFTDRLPPDAPADATGIFLDLKNGICEELRYARPADEARCEVVMSAPHQVWVELIHEQKDPLFLLMSGGVSLKKGNMMKLGQQRKAARALVKAASGPIPEPPAQPASQKNTPLTAKKRQAGVAAGRGLDFDSFPMQLFQKAKRLGIWNPADIDFTTDRQQWTRFTDEEKTVLLHLSSQFIAGEEAVTLDLLPLIQTVAREGRIEEEMYLTSFLWEEAKHTEFFGLFLRDVTGSTGTLEHFHGPAYKQLFGTELEGALQRLLYDDSPEAQLRASVTYNMIVEGTLAETGYEAYHRMLTEQDMLPGLRTGIGHLKQDESRHIAFGIYFIGRILQEHPHLFSLLEKEAARLSDMAIDVVDEMFSPYEVMPFGLQKSWFIDFATSQFRKRMEKLGRIMESE